MLNSSDWCIQKYDACYKIQLIDASDDEFSIMPNLYFISAKRFNASNQCSPYEATLVGGYEQSDGVFEGEPPDTDCLDGSQMFVVPDDGTVAILLLQGGHCVQRQRDGGQDDEDDGDQSNCLVESFCFLLFNHELTDAWSMEFVKLNCSFMHEVALLIFQILSFHWIFVSSCEILNFILFPTLWIARRYDPGL